MSAALATSLPARSVADRADVFVRGVGTALMLAGAALVFLPLLLTVYLSVFDETILSFPPKGYTLSWYAGIMGKFGAPIWTSAKIAAAAVCLALLAGVPAGIGLSRYRFRGRGAMNVLLLAPLTVPGIALGLGIFVFAIFIEEHTEAPLSGSIVVLIAAHALITTPWVIRLCLASLVNTDPAAEEAAASLGATPLQVLWRVTLPAMRPGVVAGALFAFIISFENLEMTIFLVSPGMNTLPNAILQYLIYRIDPLVAAVAVVQMVIVGAALIMLDRFVRLSQVVAR